MNLNFEEERKKKNHNFKNIESGGGAASLITRIQHYLA